MINNYGIQCEHLKEIKFLSPAPPPLKHQFKLYEFGFTSPLPPPLQKKNKIKNWVYIHPPPPKKKKNKKEKYGVHLSLSPLFFCQYNIVECTVCLFFFL